MVRAAIAFLLVSACGLLSASEPGNRLAYLNGPVDPYHVSIHTARLITPQWIGEPGVDAVVVLAIDDMSDLDKYENYLRPILERLKQIDGRAPVSIMTQSVDPADPRLQAWAQEGVSVEAHTRNHPCPCLQGSQLDLAKATFDECVDQLAQIPSGPPVAYRMPCCDSMNSVSPRFFAEIFFKVTPQGHFLSLDSSVCVLFTPGDPTLPRALVVDDQGRERFRKYIPTDRTMANYIEDYPYPYVIGNRCWEFPCLLPSDWDAQHFHGVCNPQTVRDFQVAIDATVTKQGAFALCFHPHGWIRNDQIVELIDYAARTYGPRVKFLNFREVQQRLNTNLLTGYPLRAADGSDHGVRVADLDADGLMDVVVANPHTCQTRVWRSDQQTWHTTSFPVPLVPDPSRPSGEETGVRFGVLTQDGKASVLVRNEHVAGLWHFDGSEWQRVVDGLMGLEQGEPVWTLREGRDNGVRLRDVDGDGICECVVGNPQQNGVFGYAAPGWKPLAFSLPADARIVDSIGRDAGLRFVDFTGDGRDDLIFSDSARYGAYIFESLQQGWAITVCAGERTDGTGLPMVVRQDGTNNGAWFNHGHMWVQNEDTGGRLKDHVDRRSFSLDLSDPTGHR